MSPVAKRVLVFPGLVFLIGVFAAARAGAPAGKGPPHADPSGEPLPEGAVARLGSARFYHKEAPPAVAFSPDGKLLAVAPREVGRRIFLWDYQRRRVVHHLGASSDDVIQAAFTADGRLVAVATERAVTLWDVRTGRELPHVFKEGAGVICIALAPDGKTLAVGGDLRRGKARPCVVLWDLATGKELRALPGHRTPVHALAFSADGQRLTSCSIHVETFDGEQQGRVLTWEPTSGKVLRQVAMPAAALTYPTAGSDCPLVPHKAVRLSPRGERLAFPDGNNQIHIWDLTADRELARVSADSAACAFSPDGKFLATGGRDPVQLWDADHGTEVRRFPGRRAHGTLVQGFSPDGKLLASAGTYLVKDSSLHIWAVATGKQILAPDGHQDTVTCLAFTADGQGVVTGSADLAVRLWDRAGKELRRLPAGDWEPFAVAVSPDRRSLAFVRADREAYLWDLSAVNPNPERIGVTGDPPPGSHTAFGGVPAFTHDGKALQLVRQDRVVERREKDGKVFRALEEAEGGMTAAALSPDGGLVAGSWKIVFYDPMGFAIGGRGGLGLWDAASGALLWKETAVKDPGHCLAVAFSPDGTLAAFSEARLNKGQTVWTGPVVRVREAATGREVRRLEMSDGPATGLALAPDGRTLVSVHGDVFNPMSDVLVWDLVTGKQTRRLKGHLGQVLCAAFSPDGKRLATGGADTTVLVWDAVPLRSRAKPQSGPLSAEEQAGLWKALLADDAAVAYRAMWDLAATPARGVPFFKQHLRSEPDLDGKRIAQLIQDLGSGRFTVREKATAALRKRGRLVEPALRAAAAQADLPLELRRRVETLLQKLERVRLTPEQLRTRRGLTVLEWVGDAEARRVLEALAEGGSGLLVAHQARAALDRIKGRAAAAR